MTRPLRPIDRYVRAPIGFAWFIVLMLLGVPVMIWMTLLYYAVRLARGGGKPA